jgi:hypothetical protein
MAFDYAMTAAALVGTGTKVVVIIFGFVMLGGGGALAVFAGTRMGAAQDPDITITNSQTGQSAQVGRGGLVIFIILGILLAVAGIAMLVSGFKS